MSKFSWNPIVRLGPWSTRTSSTMTPSQPLIIPPCPMAWSVVTLKRSEAEEALVWLTAAFGIGSSTGSQPLDVVW